jgi:hypothetical protein
MGFDGEAFSARIASPRSEGSPNTSDMQTKVLALFWAIWSWRWY